MAALAGAFAPRCVLPILTSETSEAFGAPTV